MTPHRWVRIDYAPGQSKPYVLRWKDGLGEAVWSCTDLPDALDGAKLIAAVLFHTATKETSHVH